MSAPLGSVVGKSLEGSFVLPKEARFAIVASRFNAFIVDRLIDGALDALTRHGCDPERLVVVRVPGCWELPQVVARLSSSGRFAGVVALGAVIRGTTPHFEYVAAEVTKGLATTALSSKLPIGFGVLTTDNVEQAVDRAGVKAGNKGFDAALAVIEMVALDLVLAGEGL